MKIDSITLDDKTEDDSAPLVLPFANGLIVWLQRTISIKQGWKWGMMIFRFIIIHKSSNHLATHCSMEQHSRLQKPSRGRDQEASELNSKYIY